MHDSLFTMSEFISSRKKHLHPAVKNSHFGGRDFLPKMKMLMLFRTTYTHTWPKCPVYAAGAYAGFPQAGGSVIKRKKTPESNHRLWGLLFYDGDVLVLIIFCVTSAYPFLPEYAGSGRSVTDHCLAAGRRPCWSSSFPTRARSWPRQR